MKLRRVAFSGPLAFGAGLTGIGGTTGFAGTTAAAVVAAAPLVGAASPRTALSISSTDNLGASPAGAACLAATAGFAGVPSAGAAPDFPARIAARMSAVDPGLAAGAFAAAGFEVSAVDAPLADAPPTDVPAAPAAPCERTAARIPAVDVGLAPAAGFAAAGFGFGASSAGAAGALAAGAGSAAAAAGSWAGGAASPPPDFCDRILARISAVVSFCSDMTLRTLKERPHAPRVVQGEINSPLKMTLTMPPKRQRRGNAQEFRSSPSLAHAAGYFFIGLPSGADSCNRCAKRQPLPISVGRDFPNSGSMRNSRSHH